MLPNSEKELGSVLLTLASFAFLSKLLSDGQSSKSSRFTLHRSLPSTSFENLRYQEPVKHVGVAASKYVL